MLLIWVAAGLTFLAVSLLTYLLKPRKEGDLPSRVRLHKNRRVLRLMHRILRNHHNLSHVRILQASAPAITDYLRQTNRSIASTHPLPAAADGEPRIMDTARDAADADEISGETLIAILQGESFDSTEILAFPVCVALALSQRLTSVLTSMLSDIQQVRQAMRVLKQLQRSKHPEQLLKRCGLNSFGLNELTKALKEQHFDSLIESVERRLKDLDLSRAELSSAAVLRSQRQTDEIRRTQDGFSALQRLNWSDICIAADEAHSLLLGDPSGVYPRLDAASQLRLRLDVSALSRRTRLSSTELIRRAFILCGLSEASNLESCVSFYFQDPQGLAALHHSLPTRRGWLYVHLTGRQELLRYTASWGIAIVTWIGFLQSGQPVFMLPFFAVLIGSIVHLPLGNPPVRMPGMQLTPGDQTLRTLVVVHAVIKDEQAASHAVQRLKATISTMHGEQADFLLIGDFTPSITAVSGFDLPIMQAVAAAVETLGDNRVMYLHRGRIWDDTVHCYRPRAGQRGAITEVCRLIAAGESQDAITFATVVPSSLERRYAYVLALGENVKPMPGLLTHFVSVMAHPLCQPYPAQKGIRGHALLLPGGSTVFDGTAFIRPDAYLEAIDGRLHDHIPAEALCGELAGQTPVDGAHIFQPHQPATWTTQYRSTLRAWQLFPWQMPIVSTPVGWVDNPLTFFQRLHLRNLLRPALIPLSRLMLLLWGLLNGNWPLMLLALILPELEKTLRRREDFLAVLCRISLLPTSAAVDVTAVIQLLRRKPDRLPDWPSLEAWVQGLSATLMAALVFILPTASSAAFALAVLFACFPLAHRLTDK